ncbi:MAG: c-type cytochrome [Thiobacillus sp.]
MYVRPFLFFSSLFLLGAFAAGPVAAKDRPPEPSPAELHARLARTGQDTTSLDEAIRRGERSAGVCCHCHGASGNSVRPEVPNLAGQNAVYLLEQMNKFVHGTRKSSEFMSGLIQALSPQERIDIALFLSRQAVAVKASDTGAHAVAGKALYGKLCVSCHGPAALGTEKIPRLAGQQPGYLEDSLKRYRAGTGERIDPMMAAYTRNLKDADIRSLAAYLTTLAP